MSGDDTMIAEVKTGKVYYLFIIDNQVIIARFEGYFIDKLDRIGGVFYGFGNGQRTGYPLSISRHPLTPIFPLIFPSSNIKYSPSFTH